MDKILFEQLNNRTVDRRFAFSEPKAHQPLAEIAQLFKCSSALFFCALAQKNGSPWKNRTRTFYTIIFYFGLNKLKNGQRYKLIYPIENKEENEIMDS